MSHFTRTGNFLPIEQSGLMSWKAQLQVEDEEREREDECHDCEFEKQRMACGVCATCMTTENKE